MNLRNLVLCSGAAALTAIGVLAVPAQAATASVQVVGGVALVYQAASGQENSLNLRLESGKLIVSDRVPLSAGPGCRLISSTQANCGSGVTGISANLGDRDDIATVQTPFSGVILGGSGQDAFFPAVSGGASQIAYDGGDGAHDEIIYGGMSSAVQVSLDGVANDGRPGIDRDDVRAGTEDVIGSRFSDTIIGNDGFNMLSGGDGNDRVEGRGGKDVLREDSQANGADTLLGGSGSDILQYLFRKNPVTVRLNGLRDDGESGELDFVSPDIELIHGGSAGDTMIGDNGANGFNGMAGNDLLSGGGGADSLIAGPGQDALFGGTGRDSLSAFDLAPVEPGDLVDCGGDVDRASVDRTDDLVGCENT